MLPCKGTGEVEESRACGEGLPVDECCSRVQHSTGVFEEPFALLRSHLQPSRSKISASIPWHRNQAVLEEVEMPTDQSSEMEMDGKKSSSPCTKNICTEYIRMDE
jgi:hypothetical protein